MIWFRDFTIPLWQVFGGNLLMLVTIMFYIAWWTVTFRPNRTGRSVGAAFFIASAFLAGLAAVMIMFAGIGSLSRAIVGYPVVSILLGAAVIYIILLAVTRIAFRRPVTAELLLITVWAALEGSVIAVLQGSKRFGMGQVWTLATLVTLATGIGLISYLLHYRIEEGARFWNGLMPLIVDAGVVAAFLAVLALS